MNITIYVKRSGRYKPVMVDVEPLTIEGVNASLAVHRSIDSDGYWAVTEVTSGSLVSKALLRSDAIAAARRKLSGLTEDELAILIHKAMLSVNL